MTAGAMLRLSSIRLIISCICFSVLCTPARAQGLPPGQHTANPQFHPDISKYIVNFTPFQFDYRIANLTPGHDRDLWFSVGSSIEHIDANDHMASIAMPHRQWIVSGIGLLQDSVVFTAGQSGKIGVVNSGTVRYFQVVPRQDFPDLRDVVANAAGEMWFLDVGRRSIGYRSSNGRVVENPFPNDAFPIQMRHCMGKLWAIAMDPSMHGTVLYVVNENLEPVLYPPVIQRPMQVGNIACDRLDRLWISTGYAGKTLTFRLDAKLHLKRFDGIGGIMAPDASGGIWMRTPFPGVNGLVLTHIDENSAMQTIALPLVSYYVGDLAYDHYQTLWLALNAAGSPVAVAKVFSKK